jgi:phasin family protein
MNATKPKDKAATVGLDAVEAMATVGKETFDSMMSMSTKAASDGYKSASTFGKDQLEAAKSGYDKMAAFGKGNFEAVSASSTAALSGVEAIYEEVVDYTKTATAQNVDLMQKFFAVKTPQEFFEVQTEAMNLMVSRSISEGTKLSKLASETMTKFVTPLKARAEGNIDSYVKPFLG